MEFIDRQKLKGKMAERSMTYDDIARILKIDKRSVGNKIRGYTQFNEEEISELKKRFGTSIFVSK
jgi:plasmid maintenance system antidote protein VapI